MSLPTGRLTGFRTAIHGENILVVTFDQPERLNALTRGAKRDLIEVLAQAQLDEMVRVVVFTGAGRAFVAGDELSREIQAQSSPRLVPGLGYGDPEPGLTYSSLRTTSQRLTQALRDLDKITIAAVNGYAIQSGLSLALACDFRIASTEARFGSATLRYGFLPDEGGHYLLLQYLGLARTLEFLLRNQIVDSTEAHDLGLVNEVVAPDELVNRALELATELSRGPQLAMRLLKRATYTAAETDLQRALDDIATKAAVSDHHPDAVEGRRAFHDKRPPRFGR